MCLLQPPMNENPTPQNPQTATECPPWYVLRFLYRDQPRVREQFALDGIKAYTPVKPMVVTRNGRSIRMQVPIMWDLLFVRSTRSQLDPYVSAYPNLQYKYKTGGKYCEPIVVPERQMNDFIAAVESSEHPLYFTPDEIDLAKGTRVRIVGGPMNGRECVLLKVKGARSRRLIVEIPDTLYAAVEVSPDLIEIIK